MHAYIQDFCFMYEIFIWLLFPSPPLHLFLSIFEPSKNIIRFTSFLFVFCCKINNIATFFLHSYRSSIKSYLCCMKYVATYRGTVCCNNKINSHISHSSKYFIMFIKSFYYTRDNELVQICVMYVGTKLCVCVFFRSVCE